MKKKILVILICTLLVTTVFSVAGAIKANYKIEDKEINLLKHQAEKAGKAPDDEYTIIDLGTLGGTWSYAGGLNDQCYVVGISATNQGSQHAFVWMCDMMTDIGTPEGFLVSGAVNVNDNGQVAGYANGQYQSQYAYLWDMGNWTYLGTLPDLDYSACFDINNPGQIVGHSFMLGPGGGSLAWIYEDGDMTELGTLGGGRSSAYGINDEGQVVGSSRTDNNRTHAFLWEDGVMTDLGVLPDEENSAAYDINENGQICGASSHTLNQYPFPTFVTACIWDGDEIIEIDKLPGYTRNNAAGGINDQGQVVGYSSDNGNNPHAFIWEDGVLTDLNDLLPEGSGWELKGAADINEKGEIVGYGKIDGETHGYLLIPPYINQKPLFSYEVPTDNSTDIPVTTTSLNVTIEDIEGDSFNWSFETSPDIGNNSGNGDNNGSKTCSISGLDYGTTYSWYVNSTDTGSGKWTREVYTFTTEMENNPPNTPSDPDPEDGATNVDINADLSWSCSDPDGDDLTYDVYFEANDPTPDVMVSNNQSENAYNPGTMDYNTHYYWLIVAWDEHGLSTDGPVWDFTTGSKPNEPPNAPNIEGPTTGTPGTEYTYTFSSIDPDGHDILEYIINWGDGTGDEFITGPFPSGEEVTASHTWAEQGTYTITAKAKDIYSAVGPEGTLTVTMPRNKALIFNLLSWLFERYPNAFPTLQYILGFQ